MNTNPLELLKKLGYDLVAQNWDSLKHHPYSTPVIRDRGGDLTKQWYIEFRYWDTNKKEMVRVKRTQIPPRYTPNRIKDVKERYHQFKVMRDAFELLLMFGWSPLKPFDASVIYEVTSQQPRVKSCQEAIDHVLTIKEQELSPFGLKGFKAHVNDFKNYCDAKNLLFKEITKIRRPHITEYLRIVKSSKGISGGSATNRTRNNYMGSLHALFEKMIEEDILDKNPAKGIKKLPETVNRFVPFTAEQMKHLAEEMDRSQPYLKQFTYFIGYAFLRPIEILRLQAMDVSSDGNYILLQADKGKTRVSHKIPVIARLAPVLQNIVSKANEPSDYLFTREQRPGPNQNLRTDYFSNRFRTIKKVVAEKHGYHFTRDHELYGIRHTFIQDLYRHLRTQKSMTKAQSEFFLMRITRHRSIDALRKYVRDYGLDLAEDWGNMYSIEY